MFNQENIYTPNTQLFSLKRNEKVACENRGAQTTQKISRHKK